MRICKKCDVKMEIKNQQEKRRGNEQKNVQTEYYCPKCDHFEHDEWNSKLFLDLKYVKQKPPMMPISYTLNGRFVILK